MATTDLETKELEEARKKKKEYDIIEWRLSQEIESKQKWDQLWPEYLEAHHKWVCSDIYRAARKPSLRAMEWNAWKRHLPGFESPSEGECRTRKPFTMAEKVPYCCKPCPWPVTTAGEVGWLAKTSSCALEIYDIHYNQKPPLPGNQRKISETNKYW